MNRAVALALSGLHAVALVAVACALSLAAGALGGLDEYHGTDGLAAIIELAFGAGIGLGLGGLPVSVIAIVLARRGHPLFAWLVSVIAAAPAGALASSLVLHR